MVKHSQSVRRLLPTNCLSVFDYFVGLAFKGLNSEGLTLLTRPRLGLTRLSR